MPVTIQADNMTAVLNNNFGLMALTMLVCKIVDDVPPRGPHSLIRRSRNMLSMYGSCASVCVVAGVDVSKWGVSTHVEARYTAHVA